MVSVSAHQDLKVLLVKEVSAFFKYFLFFNLNFFLECSDGYWGVNCMNNCSCSSDLKMCDSGTGICQCASGLCFYTLYIM